MAAVLRGTTLLAALVCLGGCGEPGSITELVVGADVLGLEVPEEVESLRFEVVTGPRRADIQQIVVPVSPRQRFAASLPVSWGLWEQDQGDAPFEVVVSAFAYLGQEDRDGPIVTQRAQLRFVMGEVRHVCLVLDASCAGMDCGAGATCALDGASPRCVPICVDAELMPSFRRNDEPCTAGSGLVDVARTGASCAPLWAADGG